MSRTDSIIVMLGLALVGTLYVQLWQPAAVGDSVSIWVMGEERLQLALSEDRIEHVQGALGISTIEVRDGRVRVLDSPGAQRICQRAGWLGQAGESAICLPNQVVVEVSGTAQFDSINF